jgi:hypothetical protein
MPRITFGLLNEGSLLRRTLVHIGTFVLGSLAFVGLLSFLLVSIAKGLLPAHEDKAASASAKDDKNPEVQSEIVSGKPSTPGRQGPRSKRGRAAPETENAIPPSAVE